MLLDHPWFAVSFCYQITEYKLINARGQEHQQRSMVSPTHEVSTCKPEVCSLIRGIKNAGSPWNLIVAAYMLDGPRRFNEILSIGEGDSLNARTLSRALKHLVAQGFVKREILATQPFAVGYSLTHQGDKLRKLLEAYRGLDGQAATG